MKVGNPKRWVTPVEALALLGIILVVGVLMVVAVNPGEALKESRDLTRQRHVEILHQALQGFADENEDAFTRLEVDTQPGTVQMVGLSPVGCDMRCQDTVSLTKCIDPTLLREAGFLTDIPFDPLFGTVSETGYYVNRQSDGRLEVGACVTEAQEEISVQ